MAISVDGNTITWTGTVTITNATDLTSGVATLILSPDGGVGVLPFFASGDPGLPPVFRNVTVNQVPYGTTVPDPSWTMVSPGGAGVASVYDLTFSVQGGQPGDAAAYTISGATDITGTPTDKYILVYNAVSDSWVVTQQKVGDMYNPTSINNYSGNSSLVTLATMVIPSQTWAWRPRNFAYGTITGTANTNVSLVCRITNATTGDQVASGPGVTGATGMSAFLIPAFETPFGNNASYGQIPAGTSVSIYLCAKQTAATTDSWSISGSSVRWLMEVAPTP